MHWSNEKRAENARGNEPVSAEVLFDAKSCDLRDRMRAHIFRSTFSVGPKDFCPRISPCAATTSTAALLVEAQGWGRVKKVGM